MTDKPDFTPTCCNQEAKWVNPTLNLAYFYCTKCKKEVEANNGPVSLTRQDLMRNAPTMAGLSAFLPKPAPRVTYLAGSPVRQFKAGDDVWVVGLSSIRYMGELTRLRDDLYTGRVWEVVYVDEYGVIKKSDWDEKYITLRP